MRDSARLLIDSVNADTRVKLVLHVGDIHSGSMPCTGAGLSPLPAGSVPSWNEGIYNLIEQFNDRLVYTPGGHKKKISTQAEDFDRRHPGDAQFVENVMWEHEHVVFVTLNLPGSNNDGLSWTASQAAGQKKKPRLCPCWIRLSA